MVSIDVILQILAIALPFVAIIGGGAVALVRWLRAQEVARIRALEQYKQQLEQAVYENAERTIARLEDTIAREVEQRRKLEKEIQNAERTIARLEDTIARGVERIRALEAEIQVMKKQIRNGGG